MQNYPEANTLPALLRAIQEAKPTTVTVGSHLFVRMSEMTDAEFEGFEPETLASVKMISPSGATVPTGCVDKLKKQFPNLLVKYIGRLSKIFTN